MFQCHDARLRAAAFACLDSASVDAAALPSRFNLRFDAADRFGDTFVFLAPFAKSRFACFRVASEVVPGFGGGSFTPARRALDSPIAIACAADRAPCLPSRMCLISS